MSQGSGTLEKPREFSILGSPGASGSLRVPPGASWSLRRPLGASKNHVNSRVQGFRNPPRASGPPQKSIIYEFAGTPEHRNDMRGVPGEVRGEQGEGGGSGEGGHRTGGTGFGGAERCGRVRGCGDTGVHGGTFEENVQNYRLETTNFVTSIPVHVYARVHPSIYIYI